MLLDGGDQLERPNASFEASFVERLHGVEAHDLCGDSLFLELVSGLDGLGQHIAGREQADILAIATGIALPIWKFATGPVWTTGSPFLPMRI